MNKAQSWSSILTRNTAAAILAVGFYLGNSTQAKAQEQITLDLPRGISCTLTSFVFPPAATSLSTEQLCTFLSCYRTQSGVSLQAFPKNLGCMDRPSASVPQASFRAEAQAPGQKRLRH